MDVLHFSKINLKGLSDSLLTQRTFQRPPFGSFEFLTMPFGLHNAISTFHQFIDKVICGLDFIFEKLDDPLIASSTEEHAQHLKSLFQRFNNFQMQIYLAKYVFGHIIDKGGVQSPISSWKSVGY